MSGREGHNALALQREYVMQLLGSVTGEVKDGGNTTYCDIDGTKPTAEHDAKRQNDDHDHGSNNWDCKRKRMQDSLSESTDEINYSEPTENEDRNTNADLHSSSDDESDAISVGSGEYGSNADLPYVDVNNSETCVIPVEDSTFISSKEDLSQMTNGTRHILKSPQSRKKATECLEELLKRAKQFSSQRINITETMFSEVSINISPETKAINEDSYFPNQGNNSNIQNEAQTDENFVESKYQLSEEVMDSRQYNLKTPKLLLDYKDEYEESNNYTKGCKWSADGELLLVLSADNKFRLFGLPQSCRTDAEPVEVSEQHGPVCIVTEGETVYDYQWYPLMTSRDPATCNFVSCCRGLPIHMWDTATGELICSYRPFNHLDELAPTNSLCFSRDGAKLVCGFNRIIRVFDTARPGRQCVSLCGKRQNGIMSCFDFHPYLHNVLAAGSYLGTVGLYNSSSKAVFSILEGQVGGVTQLTFSRDGHRLYSGARKDEELLCWDIRNLGTVLSSYSRRVDTHQRIAFTLTADDCMLLSGSTDGRVLSWDCCSGAGGAAETSFQAHDDCVNGISLHPQYPVLATSSGQRRRAPHPDDHPQQQEGADCLTVARQSSVKLWSLAA